MSSVLKKWLAVLVVAALAVGVVFGAWSGTRPALAYVTTAEIESIEAAQGAEQNAVYETMPETYVYSTDTVYGPIIDVWNYDSAATIYKIQRENESQEVWGGLLTSNDGIYWSRVEGGDEMSVGHYSDTDGPLAIRMTGDDGEGPTVQVAGQWARMQFYATTSDPYTVTATTVFYP